MTDRTTPTYTAHDLHCAQRNYRFRYEGVMRARRNRRPTEARRTYNAFTDTDTAVSVLAHNLAVYAAWEARKTLRQMREGV